VNYEKPSIKDNSNKRPKAMPIMLTITISGLKPGISYKLYRYNTLESVPECNFNAYAGDAYEQWDITITCGSTYVTRQKIESNEIAVYRAVRATAP
jgi:hypothetical protein